MNRWMMKALLAGCICAVGCGGGNGAAAQDAKESTAQGGGASSSGTGTAVGGDTDSSAPDGSFQLRLQGVDAGDLGSLLLRVKAVEVRANGMVVANTLMT